MSFTVAALVVALSSPAVAAEKDTRVFEMRVYTAAAGKLDALHARFKDHTLKLFEKHAITNVGYFVPVDNKENKLVFLLSYPSKEAREASWKAFMADADWKKAYAESEKDGKLVTDVKQTFMSPTDYSPVLKVAAGKGERVEVHVATAVSSSSGASTLWYCGGIGAPARPPYPRVGDSGHMKWSCTQRLEYPSSSARVQNPRTASRLTCAPSWGRHSPMPMVMFVPSVAPGRCVLAPMRGPRAKRPTSPYS